MTSEAVIAVASGGSALAVALFTTWRAEVRARRVAAGARADQLTAALSGFSVAVDRLYVAILELPRRRTRVDRMVNDRLDRLPNVRFLFSELGAATFGRRGRFAFEQYIAATNHLQLVAPPALLPPLEELHQLVSLVGARPDDWQERWQQARTEFLVASRRVLEGVDS